MVTLDLKNKIRRIILKKLIIFCLSIVFAVTYSNFLYASMSGKWYVQGNITTKVSAKGYKSKTMKGSIDDIWMFNSDGSFETENINGKWSQTGKKFIINLNSEDVIANFEESLTEDLETDITIEAITKMTVTGNESKNGKMNGTIKIYMNIYSEELNIHGKAVFSGTFKGTLLQTPAYDISGYWKIYHSEKKSEIGPEYLNLRQSENLLTGEFITFDDGQMEIYDVFGIISGTSITLNIYLENEIAAVGTIGSENMYGTYKTKDKHSGTWRAEKTDTIPNFN